MIFLEEWDIIFVLSDEMLQSYFLMISLLITLFNPDLYPIFLLFYRDTGDYIISICRDADSNNII